MHSPHAHDYRLLSAALALAAALMLPACGGGSSGSAAQPSSRDSSGMSSEPAKGAAATSAIKANWAAFFNAKTPASRRLSLLQNSQEFAATLRQQAGQTLAASVSSQVTDVTITSPKQADVTYTIQLDGKPVLAGAHGIAIYQDGTWKVGIDSFCSLLNLEETGSTGTTGASGLPAACEG